MNMSSVNRKIAIVLSNFTSKPYQKEEYLKESLESVCLLLDDLHCIIQNKSVDDVLKELPDIGQILGHLIVSHTVLGCPTLYKKTIKCIQRLWSSSPQTTMAKTAAQWASLQIRKSVCSSVSTEFDVCQLGIPKDKLTAEVIQQRGKYISKELKRRYKESKHALLNHGCAMATALEKDRLFTSTVKLLEKAPVDSPLLSLWEQVLDVCTLYPLENPVVQKICHRLSRSLKLHKDLRPGLSTDTCMKLWTLSKPSLEAEVLYRVELCSCHVLTSKMESIWNDSLLISVCLRDVNLYIVIYQMLQTLLEQRHIDILTSFLHCVWRQNNSQDPLDLDVIYQSCYQNLVTSLSIHPEDVPIESLSQHIRLICENFKAVIQRETTDLLVLCLQFKSWYQKCLQLCLSCDRELTSYCVEIIAYFNSVWFTVHQQQLKAVLTRLVLCLRQLMVKSSLCIDDITSVLAANQVNSQGQMKDAIHQLLLMFVYQATAGLNVIYDVIKLVISSDKESDHLTLIMQSHDNLSIDFTNWSVNRIQKYIDILTDLQSTCTEETHSDVSDKCSSLLIEIKHYLI